MLIIKEKTIQNFPLMRSKNSPFSNNIIKLRIALFGLESNELINLEGWEV